MAQRTSKRMNCPQMKDDLPSDRLVDALNGILSMASRCSRCCSEMAVACRLSPCSAIVCYTCWVHDQEKYCAKSGCSKPLSAHTHEIDETVTNLITVSKLAGKSLTVREAIKTTLVALALSKQSSLPLPYSQCTTKTTTVTTTTNIHTKTTTAAH